ncbi:hypothetical protein [Paenibacillus alkalitolerans]|uniref:hypothetical protein n=1 Tax=Paenibacillus alkalitolerans TaxID=2799335 RepID=UPI0018F33685|nr:hypothetical protein [Paenibacillus alkalitolerans]
MTNNKFSVKVSLTKVLIIGGCLAVFSAGAALAAPQNVTVSAAENQQTVTEADLLQKQKEIDEFVFEQGKDEIAKQGFTVTNTGPMDGYVEIGITPYTEAHAEYLYEKFGRDIVKVVEGVQATTLMATTEAPAPAADQAAEDALLQKQNEINDFVFGQGKDEIAQQGFTVTYTRPNNGYVEIGITPYNESHAEYLYEKFGRDIVKVVEGEQAVTFSTQAVDQAQAEASANAPAASGASVSLPVVFSVVGAVVLAGLIIAIRKLRLSGK